MGLEGSVELLKFLLELGPLLRLGEFLGSSLDGLGLWGGGSLLPGGVVSLIPLGSSELLVLVLDIMGLIFDDLHTIVINVDSILGLLDVLLKSMSEVRPLHHELLTLLGGKEFLIESLDGLDLVGFTPSLEGVLHVSDGSGVLDGLSNFTNVVELLLNLLDRKSHV